MPAVASPRAALARITRRAGRTQCFEGHAGRSCVEAGASKRLCSSCRECSMLSSAHSCVRVCQPQVLEDLCSGSRADWGQSARAATEAERTSSWKATVPLTDTMSRAVP